MNPDTLNCRRLTAGLVFPPYPLQPVDINRLYALITERYPYQTLQHLPDGAQMSNPGTNDCFIQTTRIQVNETVMHFQSAQEKTMDILEMIQDRLNIQQFMTFGVKLTAFLPFDSQPQAATFVEQRMLPTVTANADILGEGRQGTGVRMLLHREGVTELKIEPFFGDTSQLYVELDVQYPVPFSDIKSVETQMQSAYDYLFGPVKKFIAAYA